MKFMRYLRARSVDADSIAPRGAADHAHGLTHSDRPLAEVIAGRLWQSGRPVPLQAIEERGINVVVSVGGAQPWIGDWIEQANFSELDDRRPVLRLSVHAPLIDREGGLDVVAADTVIAGILRLLEDPERRVLVHCDAGRTRSVHIAACVLALRTGISGSEALGKVDAAGGRWPVRERLGLEDWDRHLAAIAVQGVPLPNDGMGTIVDG